jgi:hypothetical protein
MSRYVLILALALILISPALQADPGDDGPPIAITSPDTAVTYAMASIKSHSLVWNKKSKVLTAHVTFTETDPTFAQANDDSHEFRLPGVTFDETKGMFFATSAKGEVIPVAQFKKTFFVKSIVTTANAVVRIIHPKGGSVTVILEAISTNDPAMHPPASSDGDGTHQVDVDKLFN